LISGFDHVVIAVRDIAKAVASYETLLGRKATPITTRDDIASAVVGAGNLSVELMAPAGPGALRLRAALEDGGEGLKSLVFATADIDRMRVRCERVGLAPEGISERDGERSFRVNTDRTHGVRLFFMQRDGVDARDGGGVMGLDHIVIRTPDPERAAALYGARLGLDMRLDRDVMGQRMMFFRCGDAIVEIIHDEALTDGRDKLWGLSWRVANAQAERERLANAGLEVSDVRTGMKPGTRVFTVRNETCGVPTLMIETGPKRD
jgi:catechol 2,3-dioxygenase-like lactoylglutathione lyase family enzyme